MEFKGSKEYVSTEDLSVAVNAAINLEKPLLVKGEPGTGKTELGNILGKIYLAVGALKNDVFRVVKRSDLIAGYLGQTAIKTQKVIDQCTGGVLFIDEAYSLGNSEQRDSFSKECIDTLNQNLSEKKFMNTETSSGSKTIAASTSIIAKQQA